MFVRERARLGVAVRVARIRCRLSKCGATARSASRPFRLTRREAPDKPADRDHRASDVRRTLL